jgi:M6 family metalloprotease-like protein
MGNCSCGNQNTFNPRQPIPCMNPLKLLLLASAAIALLSLPAFAESDDARAQTVLRNAAANLGWPETITTDEDDNIGTGKTYTISEKGTGSDEDLHGSIIVFSTDQEPGVWLAFLDEQLDMDRSSYLGRDAVINRYGKNCNPTGLVKVMNDWVVGFFESIFGESDDPDKNCVTEHGAIIYACGKYLIAASDSRTDEGGEEDNIAAALFNAAEEEGICGYGDTLILMVDTPEQAGSNVVGDEAKMAQKVNEYYGVNSYGQQPPFQVSVMDSDGSRGPIDYYTIGTPMSSFNADANKWNNFETQAVQKAFNGTTLAEDVYFERIVLVYAGPPQQVNPASPFYDACDYKRDSDYVDVGTTTGVKRIYSKNFIFLSEDSELGTWSHEFGHSLPSKYMLPAPLSYDRISDRYNVGLPDRQYGEVNDWGLMGYGAWWPNDAKSPVHMESFTKNAANWLGSTGASLNQSYTLTALEDMKKGDSILTFDDPTSNDANQYFIIEARDPAAFFGAPESGVVIYKVSMSAGHHVVNAVAPQSGQGWTTNAQGRRYQKATLTATTGNASEYVNVPGKFKIRLIDKSDKSDTIKIEEIVPANLVGAAAAPNGSAIGAVPGMNNSVMGPPKDSFAPKPDLDLHAYDSEGNHIGMNYETGEYENQIPGAYASGDLVDDEEWIFVPQGTQVRFEVSTYDTQKFLQQNPSFASASKPQEYTATAIKYDAGGERYEADLGAGSVQPGQSLALKSPTDPSLKYEKKGYFGVGNNSVCPLGAALALSALACASLAFSKGSGRAN